jgi:hypothetical protein
MSRARCLSGCRQTLPYWVREALPVIPTAAGFRVCQLADSGVVCESKTLWRAVPVRLDALLGSHSNDGGTAFTHYVRRSLDLREKPDAPEQNTLELPPSSESGIQRWRLGCSLVEFRTAGWSSDAT